jgi:hypothetical protein
MKLELKWTVYFLEYANFKEVSYIPQYVSGICNK